MKSIKVSSCLPAVSNEEVRPSANANQHRAVQSRRPLPCSALFGIGLMISVWLGCTKPETSPSTVSKSGESQAGAIESSVPVPQANSPQPAEAKSSSNQKESQESQAGPVDAYTTQTQILVPTLPPMPSLEGEQGWPTFRGNPKATGVATSVLAQPEQLEVLWKHKVPKGEFQGTACLVVLQGRPVAVIGEMDGRVLALALENGEVLWTYKIKFGYACSVAHDAGHFYVGNIDGKFLCLDEQGQLQWEFSAGSQIDSSATFYRDLVLFTSQDAKLYALRKETGELAWSVEAGDQLRCAPVVADDQVFLAGCDALLRGLRLEDRSPTLEVPIDSPTGCTPAVLGDLIFFGTEQAGFKAVNIKEQALAWSFDHQGQSLAFRGNAAVTPDLVIVGDNARNVWGLDPKSGEVKWQTPLRAPVESSPVIVGEHVYVASLDGRLNVLKIQTGEKIWEREFSGQFKGSPAVGFGRLVLAGDDGVIYCLGPRPAENQ